MAAQASGQLGSGSADAGLLIEGLHKQFGEVAAVDGVSISIPKGSLLCLVGPSGCGKTTTLRMVAGLETPTRGRIRLGAHAVADMQSGLNVPPERRGLGMVFQSYAIWPHMTVRENIQFGLKLRNQEKAQHAALIDESLRLVGLQGLGERYPAQLSGGQQQRVAIARAIAAKPEVLLFDEPLSNLDEKLRESMRLEIRELQKKLQITSLYVTHSHREALAIADLIGVMNAGRIVQVAAPRDIYLRPNTRFVAQFLGFANVVESVIRGIREDALAVEVCGVESLVSRRPELEPGKTLKPGEHVTLMIRPENVEIRAAAATAPDGHLTLQGTLESKVFAGNCIEYFARLPSGELIRAEQRLEEKELQVGDLVAMNMRREHLLVLHE